VILAKTTRTISAIAEFFVPLEYTGVTSLETVDELSDRLGFSRDTNLACLHVSKIAYKRMVYILAWWE